MTILSTPSRRMIKSASHQRTNEVVERLILDRITPDSRVVDFGAGRGHMSERLAGFFAGHGRIPREHIEAFEIDTSMFECAAVDCRQLSPNDTLPRADRSSDLVLAIEVLEHCPRPYDLFRDFARILRPGGHLVFSVPNLLQITSRLSFLLTGFGTMFGPPSTDDRDAGRIAGHIMPLTLPYFVYGARRAGFSDVEFHHDRLKRSSAALSCLLMPVLRLASWRADRSLKRYDERVHSEVGWLVDRVNRLDVLASRSCIVTCKLD